MATSNLKQLLEPIEDKTLYQDTDSTNSSLKSITSLPIVTISDGNFQLTNSSLATPTILGEQISGAILGGSPAEGVSRALFANGYQQAGTKPDCTSFNGVTPNVKNPIAASCKGCPKSKWGSGQNGVGTACRGSKKVFILLVTKDKKLEVVSLRVSGKSLTNLNHYVADFEHNNVAVQFFLSNLSLATSNGYPVINFVVEDVIPARDLPVIKEFIDSPEVQEQLNR